MMSISQGINIKPKVEDKLDGRGDAEDDRRSKKYRARSIAFKYKAALPPVEQAASLE